MSKSGKRLSPFAKALVILVLLGSVVKAVLEPTTVAGIVGATIILLFIQFVERILKGQNPLAIKDGTKTFLIIGYLIAIWGFLGGWIL